MQFPTLPAIREWLLALPPDRVAGYGGDSRSCLIATAIADMTGKRVLVEPLDSGCEITDSDGGVIDYDEDVALQYNRLAVEFDTMAQGRPVSAGAVITDPALARLLGIEPGDYRPERDRAQPQAENAAPAEPRAALVS